MSKNLHQDIMKRLFCMKIILFILNLSSDKVLFENSALYITSLTCLNDIDNIWFGG